MGFLIPPNSKMNVILIELHIKLWFISQRLGLVPYGGLSSRRGKKSQQFSVVPLYETPDHLDFHSKLDYVLFERNCVSLHLSLTPFYLSFLKCSLTDWLKI